MRVWWRLTQNQTLQGALVLTAMLLVFLSTPLLNSRDHYFSGADITQSFSLLNVEPGRAGNVVLSDTIYSMQPWLMLNRENLRAGRMPLWNPYNAGGAPLLANYQSSVFSVFSLPYYLLTMRMALVVGAFLKLFASGFFTFLFLKQIKLRQVPALVGATAFMFCGYNIVFLGWPQSSTTFTLPAALYFAERIFGRAEQTLSSSQKLTFSSIWHNSFWSLGGFLLVLAAGLMAGHPETFYFALLPVALYVLFRLGNLWHSQGYRRFQLGPIFKLAGLIAGASVVAAVLCSVQLLPFFEYLLNADRLSGTDSELLIAGRWAFQPAIWPFYFMPNMLGMEYSTISAFGSNYVEINSLHAGGFMLLLGLISLRFVAKDKFVAFFSGLFSIWLVYSFNVFGLGNWFKLIPGMSLIWVGRSQVIGLFCLICAGAIALNWLYSGQNDHKDNKVPAGVWGWLKTRQKLLLALAISSIGLGMLTLSLVGVREFLAKRVTALQPHVASFVPQLEGQVWLWGLTFGAGLLALLTIWLTRSKTLKATMGAVLVLVVFTQTGFTLKDFNPTIPDRFFYPATPAMAQLKAAVGNEQLAIVGWDTIPSDVNSVYNLAMPHHYDALYVKHYNELGLQMFGNRHVVLSIFRASETALRLFGVEYLFTPGDFSFDMGLNDAQFGAKQTKLAGEIVPGQTLSQTFKALEDDLRLVSVQMHTYGRLNNCTVQVKLEDIAATSVIKEQAFACQEIKNDHALELIVPPVSNSRNRDYRLTLTSSDSKPGNAVTAWVKSDFSYADGKLQINGQPSAGGLSFNFLSGNLQNFERVTKIAGRTLYRYKNSPSRYHTVSQMVALDSDQAIFDLVRQREFDPGQKVAFSQAEVTKINNKNAASNVLEPPAPAKVLNSDETNLRFNISRQQPGFLVLTTAYYPGWKARVNGVEKPVLRANYAFNAVELAAGENKVEVYYEPDSFRYGALLTLLSLGGLVSLVLIRLVGRYRANRNPKGAES